MFEKKYLNTLINHVVFTIDNIFKEKESSPNLLNYLYLITTGMILTYGDEIVEKIYKTLDKINFISNLSKSATFPYNYSPTNSNYLKEFIKINSFNSISFIYELEFPEINNSSIKTLEYLTYELNSILFYKKQEISFKENIKVKFNYLTSNIVQTYYNSEIKTIDKVFNLLQTEEIIKVILSLPNQDIKNTKFKKALNYLKNINGEIYKIEGLDIIVTLLRPLFNMDDIKKILNSANNKLIEKEFEQILGNNAYKKISQKIESLNKLISNSKIDNNYYNLSLKYIDIKNNFINRYINLKYAYDTI